MIALVLVAAIADNGVIGRGNALPWHLKSDLKHFRALTLGKPVLMGRKTFESIGRPLPGRTNVVVSRDACFAAAGIVAAARLEDALAAAAGDALRRNIGEIMVVGGADIYAALMPRAARLEITHVHVRPDGDAMFPPIDPAVWRATARAEHAAGAGDDAAFTLVTYCRAGGGAP
jgi:dihydrofolate reductase